MVSDTRPISVTNTDNRLLASTVARAIMPAVSTLLDPAQRGFLARINGHSHTEDLNEFFYQGVATNTQRYVFLLDTAKAFDSIDHRWIFKVLEKAEFPIWLRHFVRCSLHDVKVAPFFGGPPSCFIPIERGVKQGCPLSPLLFIISYDPLLTALRSRATLSISADSVSPDSVSAAVPAEAVSVSAESVPAVAVPAESVSAGSVSADSVPADSASADSVSTESVSAESRSPSPCSPIPCPRGPGSLNPCSPIPHPQSPR